MPKWFRFNDGELITDPKRLAVTRLYGDAPAAVTPTNYPRHNLGCYDLDGGFVWGAQDPWCTAWRNWDPLPSMTMQTREYGGVTASWGAGNRQFALFNAADGSALYSGDAMLNPINGGDLYAVVPLSGRRVFLADAASHGVFEFSEDYSSNTEIYSAAPGVAWDVYYSSMPWKAASMRFGSDSVAQYCYTYAYPGGYTYWLRAWDSTGTELWSTDLTHDSIYTSSNVVWLIRPLPNGSLVIAAGRTGLPARIYVIDPTSTPPDPLGDSTPYLIMPDLAVVKDAAIDADGDIHVISLVTAGGFGGYYTDVYFRYRVFSPAGTVLYDSGEIGDVGVIAWVPYQLIPAPSGGMMVLEEYRDLSINYGVISRRCLGSRISRRDAAYATVWTRTFEPGLSDLWDYYPDVAANYITDSGSAIWYSGDYIYWVTPYRRSKLLETLTVES